MRRGDLIRAVDGIPVDRPAAPWLSGGGTRGLRFELVSRAGEVRELTIVAGAYTRHAVSAEKVIEHAGRRVGYLELQHFLRPADEEFVQAATRLGMQRIDDLVLDLRRNGGGSVGVARRVAEAIGGERLNGRTFVRLLHNGRYRDRDYDSVFAAPDRVGLSLARVFIITSNDTCSASEALINGLAPHMQVVTIGATTCGKPVGSQPVEYGERVYSVIGSTVRNARGEGDYYAGLRPTCAAENDVTRELGDPAEASLAAALHYIRFGRCPESPADPF